MRYQSAMVGKRKAPPERGAAAPLGAVLLGPHKAPAIHAAQHERAGRARVPSATGFTAGLPEEEPPAAPAILHGLARRTAPFSSQAVGLLRKKAPPRGWGLQRGH